MEKHLLFVEANTTGTGMQALLKAHQLGFSPLFFTNNPSRYIGLTQVPCPVVVCDTNCVNALMRTIATCLQRDELLGITTTSEFYLETVAALVEAYSLPGNSSRAMHMCRNKAQSRLLLTAAQMQQPRFTLIHTLASIDEALRYVELPCVVKPPDDTGSNEVRLCRSRQEVEQQARRILSTHVNVRGQHTAQSVMVEEFLDAPEYSVEMFTWQGVPTCIGITEKHLVGFPYFVEYRHIFPAALPPAVAQEMEVVVRHALEITDVTHGATHTEVKLTPHGCAIIEINARLAGGMIPEIIRLATGIDLVEQQLKVAVGAPPCLHGTHSRSAGIQFLVSPGCGILEGVRGIKHAQRMDGIEQVVITAPVGTPVALPQSAYHRLGYVIAQAGTYEEVAFRLHHARAALSLRLGPCASERTQEERYV